MAKLIKYLKDLPKDIRYEFLRQNDELELESMRFPFKGTMVKGTFFFWNGVQYLVIYNEEYSTHSSMYNSDGVSDMISI